MRLLIVFLLINIIPNTSYELDGVDYNHRKIGKEIAKTFDIGDDEFILDQINIDPALIGEKEKFGRFYNIIKEQANSGYLYVGRVNTCPAGGCDDGDPNGESYEYFDYLLIFNSSVAVEKVAVFNYQATHGQEICAKGWLKQFVGFSGNKTLKVGRNIDSISVETRSTNSITADIIRTRELLYLHIARN